MGLFKSKDERRIEREMKVRSGLRSIEKSDPPTGKVRRRFHQDAQHARRSRRGQYLFIRSALKRTAAVKKMLERQLLSMKNAVLIQQQRAGQPAVCRSMT